MKTYIYNHLSNIVTMKSDLFFLFPFNYSIYYKIFRRKERSVSYKSHVGDGGGIDSRMINGQ